MVRRLLLWAGHDARCRARVAGMAAEVRAIQEWAAHVEADAAARLTETGHALQEARDQVAALTRDNRDMLLDKATAEVADLRLEVQILRTRLEGGNRSELLRERETSRVLEQRNATLREENEALKANLRT
ncbi:hypothetical protein ABT352_33525 [Streptosporangium sp. NPDC000563]|uniref:hypothetical protein n=1 Tax=Streptosporangium sp. NPDC000563 TaxID=3154366 RepID=UPI00332A0534